MKTSARAFLQVIRIFLIVAFNFLVTLVGNSGKISEALRSQAFEPLCLGEEYRPQSFAHLAFANHSRERSDGAGASGNPNIRMLSLRKNISGNNAPLEGGRKRNQVGLSGELLVQDGLERRFFNDLKIEGVFGSIQLRLHILLGEMAKVHRPYADLGNLEWIKDIFCYGIAPSPGEMPAEPNAEPFVSLADVNGLAIIVVEGIDAAFDATNALPFCIHGSEECLNFAADCRDIQRLSFRFPTCACGLS